MRLALVMECPKAGEFQSTLKAGVTDRTAGHFKVIVGNHPRSRQHFTHLKALTGSLLTSQLPPGSYTRRKEGVLSGNQ